ncbi:uncharacterized protein KIAA1143 homolog [Tachypleus tridentatus]|uniref:uncharacterized protein KIAA1143 homolog n=1 Tax=Tachypleus tridentatus TaxID=6853 RepID=UPI003FD55DCA
MAGKRNITYNKPAEPSFLKKLKERIGYQEGPSIETKKQLLPVDDTSDEERDDEKPLVVVLEKGDLTYEEAENYKYSKKPVVDDEGLCGKKILYKKPTKRSIRNDENPTKSCTKKKTQDKDRTQPKKVKNSSLLSFDEDEEEG